MRLPPVNGLRAFEAAARHESFSAAAAELKITAAAVSQHVRALEAWLGIPLFRRHVRGVSLTVDGRDFGVAVSQGFTQIARAAAMLSERAHRPPVILAGLASVMTRWLIPKLPRFRADHPDIRLTIRYALPAQTPDELGADLLIQHLGPSQSSFVPLLGAETRPTASRDYIARHGPFPTPRSLASAELLNDETPEAWARWFAGSGIADAQASGPIFADFNLLVGAILDGQGVGLCPTVLIAPELASGRLVTLFGQPSDTDRYYGLVAARRLSADATVLRDWLAAIGRDGEPPSGPRSGRTAEVA